MKRKIKVLWFSVTPSLYPLNKGGLHNGGGWISSLEQILRTDPEIELGIAFEHTDTLFKKECDDVTYYPIHAWTSRRSRLEKKVSVASEEKYIIPKCFDVIADFQPDVIHVFGSEWCFGLVVQHTDIPVVIHIQGCLPAYYNAWYPVGISIWNFLFSSKLSMKKKIIIFKADRMFHRKALREERILRLCQNYMGRTHWDKSVVHLYNPQASYYHCEEALRAVFTSNGTKWNFQERSKIVLVSTLSVPWYKGVDVVLKTAKLLKESSNLDFEWQVYGVSECRFFEEQYGIDAKTVNVRMMGVVAQEVLSEALLNATLYIHPTYIDNSPNSVCEAQILGVPAICTNVGGVSSLVEDRKTGFLVPANDPIKIADTILTYWDNKTLLSGISKNAISVAGQRHNPETIKANLISIYKKLIDNK
jgi:glycosyltransferase involved in cell wall biosynthesis